MDPLFKKKEPVLMTGPCRPKIPTIKKKPIKVIKVP